MTVFGIDFSNIPFVKATYFEEVDPLGRQHQVIVIHTMECADNHNSAKSTADYFASDMGGREASAHYNIDDTEIVQSVQCKDIAYGARGYNQNAIHLEHAGYAAQTATQWESEYNQKMLKISATLCGLLLCPKYSIPARFLSDQELLDSKTNPHIKGFSTHRQISRVFNIPGGHTDPGPSFPENEYVEMVQKALSGRSLEVSIPQEIPGVPA